MSRILLVDDEARIREVVQYALERDGHVVAAEADGSAGLGRLSHEPFDLVVLDVSMPGLDGLELMRRLRSAPGPNTAVPVLFLSARGDEIDRVLGLELGGDDYLVKPFSPRELAARVKALLRRVPRASATVPGATGTKDGEVAAASNGEPGRTLDRRRVVHGLLTVDLERWEVRVGETPVELTRTELLLLSALLERPGVVLSRGQLVQRAYLHDNLITERTIDTHVRRVRAKLRQHGVDPITTVYGVGYKASDG